MSFARVFRLDTESIRFYHLPDIGRSSNYREAINIDRLITLKLNSSLVSLTLDHLEEIKNESNSSERALLRKRHERAIRAVQKLFSKLRLGFPKKLASSKCKGVRSLLFQLGRSFGSLFSRWTTSESANVSLV